MAYDPREIWKKAQQGPGAFQGPPDYQNTLGNVFGPAQTNPANTPIGPAQSVAQAQAPPTTAAGLYDALMRTIWGGAGGHAAPEWYAQNRDRLIGEVFPTWLSRMDPNATYGNILGRAQGDPTSAFLQLRKQLGLGHDPSFD